MNEQAVRAVAQSDPVPNLTARWGEVAQKTSRAVDVLVVCLRELDSVQEQLANREITVDINLNPVGEAAKAARRDLERQRDEPTFVMPRP